ncbi:hypothetical protein EBU71_15355 [bacterium]|nr:hypothetical protein [Candidatus Elulimicrobium humile]
MDPVLSRKLFRQKYVEEIKPHSTNKGGIATLKLATGGEVFTEGEKLGYMLAPVAASLLQAKQAPGQSQLSSLFSAVGEGISKTPDIAVAIKKVELAGQKQPKATNLLMTPEMLKAANLPEGTVAQINSETGAINVVSKPDAEALKTKRELTATLRTLDAMEDDYNKLNKPVGPFALDINRIQGILGRATGSEYGERYAGFVANHENLRAFFNRAISGATIPKEEFERLKSITPSVSDTEAQWEGKAKNFRRYVNDVLELQKNNPNLTPSGAVEVITSKGGAALYAPKLQPGLKTYSVKDGNFKEVQ